MKSIEFEDRRKLLFIDHKIVQVTNFYFTIILILLSKGKKYKYLVNRRKWLFLLLNLPNL